MDKETLVRIEWEDAHSVDEWSDPMDNNLFRTDTVTTVGQLIRETSEAFIVSLNVDKHEDRVSCSIVIPKTHIKHMEYI